MESALLYHRLQFAVTATFHYLFPQLTMGLALFLFFFHTQALRSGDPRHRETARFWTKVFAFSFGFGVVTGIPLEFQFGTNWARFSNYAGGVIGQTLAMEGVFAFFLESSFLGVLVYGERRFGPRAQWVAALMILLGSWLSGYFILATNAWMQHPVAYTVADDGRLVFIAMLGGHKSELNVNDVMRRRLTITGSTLRPRPTNSRRRPTGTALIPSISAAAAV